jgi:hypothetical protein
VTATLSRGGVIYARGSSDASRPSREFAARTLRHLTRGEYTLTVTIVRSGRRTIVKHTVFIG